MTSKVRTLLDSGVTCPFRINEAVVGDILRGVISTKQSNRIARAIQLYCDHRDQTRLKQDVLAAMNG